MIKKIILECVTVLLICVTILILKLIFPVDNRADKPYSKHLAYDFNISQDNENSKSIPLKIDINLATEEELCLLKGVGQATAKRIVVYRKEKGYFNSCNELLYVKGIGEHKYNMVKDFICANEKNLVLYLGN